MKIEVWAHRGASGYAPENTLPAFLKAYECGADGVELDVQMTKDGQLVVIHDELIDRTSDGKGLVCDYTFGQLRQFNFNQQFPEYGKVLIPTLEEVLLLMKEKGMYVNIELKTSIVFYEGIEEKVLQLVKDLKMENQVIYSSFNHYSIVRIKELNPDAKCGLLYDDIPVNMCGYASKLGVEALHPLVYTVRYPHFMKEAQKAHLDINVWTVNEPRDIQLSINAHVHAIITNYPDRVKTMMKN